MLCFCYTFCNAPLWGYEMKLSTCNLHDICAMLIREKGVRGHPKLLIVKWLGVIVLQLGLGSRIGSGNGFHSFFSQSKLMNTSVWLFRPGPTSADTAMSLVAI